MNHAKAIQRSKNDDLLQKNIDTLRKHCRKNSLDEDWLDSWVDVRRVSREGLFNTNDFTEALLIAVLVETVFPFYEDMVEVESNRKVILPG